MRTPLLAAVSLVAFSGCNFREFVIDQTVREQVHYVPDVEHFSGAELTKVAEGVYTFRWTWDRSLVVQTSEGFVVTDPFSEEAAKILKSELAKLAPGVPVRMMIYSHYHLDHVVGGAALEAKEILAHKKCPELWAQLSEFPATRNIAMPTRLIEGDQHLTIGGVQIELIALARSHTDNMYAVYLPQTKVLHTADTGLVRTIYPMGGPDMFFPGMISEMERLSKLDFDAWIPTHFEAGKKADFIEALEFTRETHALARAAWTRYGLPKSEDDFATAFHAMYGPLKAKYAHYRGWKEQGLFHVTRAYSGAVLGY